MFELLLITTCLYSHGVCNQEGNAYLKTNPDVSQHLNDYGTVLRGYSEQKIGKDATYGLFIVAYGLTQRTALIPINRHYNFEIGLNRQREGHEENYFGLAYHF